MKKNCFVCIFFVLGIMAAVSRADDCQVTYEPLYLVEPSTREGIAIMRPKFTGAQTNTLEAHLACANNPGVGRHRVARATFWSDDVGDLRKFQAKKIEEKSNKNGSRVKKDPQKIYFKWDVITPEQLVKQDPIVITWCYVRTQETLGLDGYKQTDPAEFTGSLVFEESESEIEACNAVRPEAVGDKVRLIKNKIQDELIYNRQGHAVLVPNKLDTVSERSGLTINDLLEKAVSLGYTESENPAAKKTVVLDGCIQPINDQDIGLVRLKSMGDNSTLCDPIPLGAGFVVANTPSDGS